MSREVHCQIAGPFHGYNGGAIFRLTNGQAWQQRHYRYSYRYAYRPKVRIYKDSSRYMMEVAVMSEPIEVIQVQIAVEGPIVSEFSGFNQDMKFQFENGEVWQQAEYKYNYHYAHWPHALVVDGINGYELHVDDMNESVRVQRLL